MTALFFFIIFIGEIHPDTLLQAEEHSSRANLGAEDGFSALVVAGVSYSFIHVSVLLFSMVHVLLPREGNLGLSCQLDLWYVLVHFTPSKV